MEIENGPYLTEIETNSQIDKQRQLKFKRQLIHTPNQCSLISLRKNTLQKLPSSILKQNKLKYRDYPAEEYYEGKVLKPGAQIYKAIIDLEEKRKQNINIPKLKLRLPNTTVMDEGSYSLIHCGHNYVDVREEFTFKDLMMMLNPNYETQGFHCKIFPAALLAIGNTPAMEHQIFLSNQIYTRLLPKSQTQACIQFIDPFGNYPNVLRLFYHPKRNKNWKPNIGYKIVNKKQIDEQMMNRKHKQIHNYLIKDYEKQQNLNITVVKGKALLELEEMSQSIIDYLEYWQNVRITEIIVDFIFCKDRFYYFHEIRGIKSHPLTKIWDIGDSEQILTLVQEKVNQVVCKLCGLSFKKQQVNHKVTKKLIYELVTHLKNRGGNTSCFAMSNITSNNFSSSCQVCQLCYELILAQHQLIDIQHEFCQILNINLDPLLRVPSIDMQRPTNSAMMMKTINTGLVVQKPFQPAKLYQWRIFFYLEKIKNLPIEADYFNEMSLSMICKGFSETFNKKILNEITLKTEQIKTFRTQLKPYAQHQNKKTHHTSNTYNTYRTQDNSSTNYRNQKFIDLQKVKVFVFYTKQPDITQLIHKEELHFQMTLSNGKKAETFPFKMKGQSSTMKNFVNTQRCQQHSCQVLLFDEKYRYCNLQLNIGLKFDTVVSESEVNYSQSQDGMILYPSQKQNRNCMPLPEQWIEMINNGQGRCMLQEIPEQAGQMKKPKKQLKQAYLSSTSSRFKHHKQDSSIEDYRYTSKKRNSKRQSLSRIHPRPQTCFLSQSSRQSIKRSKFNKNLLADASIFQHSKEDNEDEEVFEI